MNCSLPGSFIQGILQARIMEWVAILFSRGSFWPRDLPDSGIEPESPALAGGFVTAEPPREWTTAFTHTHTHTHTHTKWPREVAHLQLFPHRKDGRIAIPKQTAEGAFLFFFIFGQFFFFSFFPSTLGWEWILSCEINVSSLSSPHEPL